MAMTTSSSIKVKQDLRAVKQKSSENFAFIASSLKLAVKTSPPPRDAAPRSLAALMLFAHWWR
jgi:hypothetical protein